MGACESAQDLDARDRVYFVQPMYDDERRRKFTLSDAERDEYVYNVLPGPDAAVIVAETDRLLQTDRGEPSYNPRAPNAPAIRILVCVPYERT